MSDDNVVRFEAYRERPAEPIDDGDDSLKHGGGGGTSGGMEARLAKLEAHMEHVLADVSALKADVGKLKTDMATLVERVSHLPTKGFIVSATLTTLAMLTALTAFAPVIQRFFGIAP